MKVNMLDRLSFLSLFLLIILLPVFFLPGADIPIEVSKGFLLVLGLAISIICWAVARFFDGEIVLPKSMSLLGALGIVIVFFLSALFSKFSQVSFFGAMFDIGSFWFIFSGFLLMFMSSIIFRNPKRARLVLFGTILLSALALVFQILRLLAPEALSLGILIGKTGNLLGSWNAFGIFAGFSGLMSLLALEFFSTTRMEKWILKMLIILSMIFIAAVNFPLVWILLGISSLIIFVYKVSITSRERNRAESPDDTAHSITDGDKKNFPAFSFFLILVSLLFLISGQFVGGILPNRLGLLNTEISPSFGATMGVTKSVLLERPILGLGPNKFQTAWAMYKPAEINTSAFWDIPFGSGSGLLPTLVSTTGYLGILAWLFFLFSFLYSGVKSIFSSIKSGANWETMAFFVLSLYLFVSSFFYSGGTVIFLLALAFAGIFIGLSASSGKQGEISLSFLHDHRTSFFSILILVFVIIFSSALSFKYMQRFVSVSYFRKALTAQDISVAETSINKALVLYGNDLYLRAYAQVYLVKLNTLVQKGTSLSDEDKALLQANLDQAVNGAELSTTYDGMNYLNFQTLGSLYQALGSFGIKDAYGKAVEAYKTASTLNPKNPGLKLSVAGAYFSDKRNKEAKDYANESLSLKPNYIDALIFLSQVAKMEGDNASAFSYAQRALAVDPANKDLINYANSLDNQKSSNPTPPETTLPKTENNSNKKNP